MLSDPGDPGAGDLIPSDPMITDPTVGDAVPNGPAQSDAGGMGARTALGILWFILQNLSSRATAFLSQIVLAWILSPADFGLIGLTYVVTNVAATLVNFGIDDVLTQRQHRVQFWTGSALWVGLGLGMAGAVGVVAISPFAAALYRQPPLIGLLAVLAVSMPIGTLSTVPTVLLRAQLRFTFLAAYSAIELITQQLFTIVLAWRGCGAYSFVIPVPVMALVRVAVFWSAARPSRRRLIMRRKQAGYLMRNGATVFGSKLITSAIGQGDYAILGVFASSATVGAYFFAFRLAAQPVFLLAGNFNAVIYPVLARFRGEPKRQRDAALRASRMLAHITLPLGFIQAAVAGPLLRTFFGSRWLSAIPLIEILSIGLAFDAVPWIAGALLAARGGFARNLWYSLISLPLFFALILAGVVFGGAVGVALGVAVYYLVYAPTYSYVVFRREGATGAEVAALFWKPALLAALATGAGLLAAVAGARLSPNGVWLALVIGAVSCPVYAGLVRLFSPSTFEDVAGRLRHMLAAKLPRRWTTRFA